MAIITDNYNLILPEAADQVDIDDLNANFKVIDEKLYGKASSGGWTPNMYLGTDADGNMVAREGVVGIMGEFTGKCLYNGVELPAAPEEWDRVTYPYGYIIYYPDLVAHWFIVADTRAVASSTDINIGNKEAENEIRSFMWRWNPEVDSGWFADPDGEYVGPYSGWLIGAHVWSNVDILSEDGTTVEFRGSIPVPIYSGITTGDTEGSNENATVKFVRSGSTITVTITPESGETLTDVITLDENDYPLKIEFSEGTEHTLSWEGF